MQTFFELSSLTEIYTYDHHIILSRLPESLSDHNTKEKEEGEAEKEEEEEVAKSKRLAKEGTTTATTRKTAEKTWSLFAQNCSLYCVHFTVYYNLAAAAAIATATATYGSSAVVHTVE